MRINYRQWLIEQDRINVGTHQPPAQGNFLLVISAQPTRLAIGQRLKPEHGDGLLYTNFNFSCRQLVRATSVAQGECKIFRHRHGVVQHRELEYLGNISLLGWQGADVHIIKQQLAFTGVQQPGDDIKQGCFSTTRRAQQRVGAAVVPLM